MAQGEGFKHITVTAAEDEDVVILAGAMTAGEPEIPEPIEAPVEAPQTAEKPIEDAGLEPQPVATPPIAEKKAASKRPKTKNEYHETTLEDLQDSPMPLTQKIVIVAAIVCIIGAVIYYFAFMG